MTEASTGRGKLPRTRKWGIVGRMTPFPWAAVIATGVALALAVWAWMLRRPGAPE